MHVYLFDDILNVIIKNSLITLFLLLSSIWYLHLAGIVRFLLARLRIASS